MKDLTQGSVLHQVLAMAAPIGIGMLVQTLYFMVDLYFVGQLGSASQAGVSAAGNVMMINMALTQTLGVGAVSLVAQAVGRGARDEVNLIFNQSLAMAGVCFIATLVAGYTLSHTYMRLLGAEGDTASLGVEYLWWYAPGLALQFPLNAMAFTLRGTGVVKPAMKVQLLTVVLNIVLAPVLIAGWGTGLPLGVAGAGLASSLSIAVGVAMLARHFTGGKRYVRFDWKKLRPQWALWRRLLGIGFPAGAEFGFMFVNMTVIFAAVSQFGPAAMAGVGVGSRVMQAIFMPAMAIAFALPAVAGQNVGAGAVTRVREAVLRVIQLECVLMAALSMLCKLRPDWLVGSFVSEPEAGRVAAEFLNIISWNFIASGLIFSCSGFFQAVGNTWPSLASTATRVLTFVLPILWLSRQPGFTLLEMWYLSVATVSFQALVSMLLLRWQWLKWRDGLAAGAKAAES